MKKLSLACLIFSISLLMAGYACAYSASISNPDNFYSPGDYMVNLSVDTTGIANVSFVQVNFSNISPTACGPGGVIGLTNTTTTSWSGNCSLSTEIAAITASTKTPQPFVIVVAVITAGPSNITALPIFIHDLGTPSMGANPCQRFGILTTNFSKVLDFADVNFIIQIEMNGSCLVGLGNGSSPWNDYEQVMMMNFSSLNMSSNTTLLKLQNLKDDLQVNITPPHEIGLTRVYLNDTAFAELNTNTTITLNNIPFASIPAILPDNASRGAANVTWTLGAPFNITIQQPTPRNISVPQGTLQFKVTGFSGYNITDNQTPIITINKPSFSETNNSNVVFNATLNGTGTGISLANFLVDGISYLQYNASNPSGLCSSGTEVITCQFSNDSMTNGNHTLLVEAYDYGGASGNYKNKTAYILVDNTAPILAFTNLNSTTYIAPTTTYKLNGTANDTLSGLNNVTILVNGTVNGTATWSNAQWNYTLTGLSVGTYNITARAYDALGNTNAVSGILIVYNGSPALSLTTPNGTDYINLSFFTLAFTASDSIGLSQCWYTLTGLLNITNQSISCSSSMPTFYLASGAYAFNLYANNTIDNFANTSVSFNVNDTRVPLVSDSMDSTFDSSTTQVIVDVTTDENATCKYSTSSSSTTYDSMNSLFTDNITDHYFSKSVTAGISYNIYVRCRDMSGNTNNVSHEIDFSIDAVASTGSTGSGSGSSGGGGALGSTSGALQDYSGNLMYDMVNSVPLDVQVPSMLFTDLIVTANQAVTGAKFSVTKQDTAPLPYTNNTIYTYMSIEHENLDDSMVSSVTIKFRVERSWLSIKNFLRQNVYLVRMDNGWTALNTTFISEDATYDYYQAASPGLSLYGIAAKPTPIAAPVIANATNVTAKNVTGNATTNATVSNNTLVKAPSTGKNNWPWLAGAVLLLILAFIWFYYTNYGRKTSVVSKQQLEKDIEKDVAKDLERDVKSTVQQVIEKDAKIIEADVSATLTQKIAQDVAKAQVKEVKLEVKPEPKKVDKKADKKAKKKR